MSAEKSFDLSEIDLETARQALAFCDYSDRDEWVQMGMALKSEFGEDAFPVWDDWSRQDESYKEKSALSSWKSFKRSGLTIGTLIGKALEKGFKFDRQERSEKEKKKQDKERKKRLELRAQEQADADAKTDAWRLKLSDFLTSILDCFTSDGYSNYLQQKKVPGFGLLFPSEPMIVVADEALDRCELIRGHEAIAAFWAIDKDERPAFRFIKRGVVGVPLFDIDGRLWNMQLIYKDGGKTFFAGRKAGCFHIIGSIPPAGRFNLCAVEGYANGACIHMALGCPVLVALDSGNLAPVVVAHRSKYGDRINKFAICADNDLHLEAEGKKNVGKEKALAAAGLVGGFVVLPKID